MSFLAGSLHHVFFSFCFSFQQHSRMDCLRSLHSLVRVLRVPVHRAASREHGPAIHHHVSLGASLRSLRSHHRVLILVVMLASLCLHTPLFVPSNNTHSSRSSAFGSPASLSSFCSIFSGSYGIVSTCDRPSIDKNASVWLFPRRTAGVPL